MIALTDRERLIAIIVATALVLVDVVRFPTIAQSLVFAAPPAEAQTAAAEPNLVIPSTEPTTRDFTIATAQNPYRADLQPAPPVRETGKSVEEMRKRMLASGHAHVAGDAALMGDITADDLRGTATPGVAGAAGTSAITVLANGDDFAAIQVGTNTEFVQSGAVIDGKRIVSISAKYGVRMSDGSTLPSATATESAAPPSPPPPPSGSPTPAATPTPLSIHPTPAPKAGAPGSGDLTPALRTYLQEHHIYLPPAPSPTPSGAPQ